MNKSITFIFFFLLSFTFFSQQKTYVSGTVLNSKTNLPIENVNIVNLNKVIGTATAKGGEFEINAQLNDTLHFSYLGYKYGSKFEIITKSRKFNIIMISLIGFLIIYLYYKWN